jgi:hypothetical protein
MTNLLFYVSYLYQVLAQFFRADTLYVVSEAVGISTIWFGSVYYCTLGTIWLRVFRDGKCIIERDEKGDGDAEEVHGQKR